MQKLPVIFQLALFSSVQTLIFVLILLKQQNKWYSKTHRSKQCRCQIKPLTHHFPHINKLILKRFISLGRVMNLTLAHLTKIKIKFVLGISFYKKNNCVFVKRKINLKWIINNLNYPKCKIYLQKAIIMGLKKKLLLLDSQTVLKCAWELLLRLIKAILLVKWSI